MNNADVPAARPLSLRRNNVQKLFAKLSKNFKDRARGFRWRNAIFSRACRRSVPSRSSRLCTPRRRSAARNILTLSYTSERNNSRMIFFPRCNSKSIMLRRELRVCAKKFEPFKKTANLTQQIKLFSPGEIVID